MKIKFIQNNRFVFPRFDVKMASVSSFAKALLVLYMPASCLGQSVVPQEKLWVPSLTLTDLKFNGHSKLIATALSSHGIIAVTQVHPNMKRIRQDSLGTMCKCLKNEHSLVKFPFDNSDISVLSDGMTIRSSLATATINDVPLPMPTQEMNMFCSSSSFGDAMEELREITHDVSSAFVKVLDDLVLNSQTSSQSSNNSFKLKNIHGRTYSTIEEIVRESNNLEHFHVYSKEIQLNSPKSNYKKDVDRALTLHTDAGLFLAFVPAVSCNEESQDDTSFMVSVDGILRQAVFPNNSVIIMLGSGAEHWLKNIPKETLPLKATKHAVQMSPGNSRAWYGMSKL